LKIVANPLWSKRNIAQKKILNSTTTKEKTPGTHQGPRIAAAAQTAPTPSAANTTQTAPTPIVLCFENLVDLVGSDDEESLDTDAGINDNKEVEVGASGGVEEVAQRLTGALTHGVRISWLQRNK
jgi:hypothetical protein